MMGKQRSEVNPSGVETSRVQLGRSYHANNLHSISRQYCKYLRDDISQVLGAQDKSKWRNEIRVVDSNIVGTRL